jgi:CrcB protein
VKTYLWIALGSALGGMARHWIGGMFAAKWADPFPWGTFLVNVTGSLLIGMLAALPDSTLPGTGRAFLIVGVLGGYTTFSAFSLQTAMLMKDGITATALVYAIASVVACPAAAAIGWALLHRHG